MHPHQPQGGGGPAPLHPRAETEQRCLINRCGSGLVPAGGEALLGQHFSMQGGAGQAAPRGRDAGYSHHNQIPAAKGFIAPLNGPGVLCRAEGGWLPCKIQVL